MKIRKATIARALQALAYATCTPQEFYGVNPGKDRYDYANACAAMLGITSRAVRRIMHQIVSNDASYDGDRAR